MLNNIISFATGSAPQQGFLAVLIQMGPIILIIIGFMFIMSRSQKKKAKERQNMLDSLRSGEKIMTVGGLIGTIVNVKEKILVVKVANGINVEISKNAVSSILEKSNKTEK